ncbi:HIT family protein [Candidatus Woesearchaeota archaeon]|nr:HIT family protein [Candidatus Woesearchaeota archaeon]HIH38222.1 HIT family protein [Candidatus Woesearchaeota archaeon]HIH49699.1 HIT family protein [Candidatus Woesearchaeota archaeon]HIJ03193.1 HIT family protein [Candidatus Woesearchaeota archaeon]
MNDCIFCKIIEKQIPSTIIYEDTVVLGILDINPANKGHVLIIVKNHYPDTITTPEDEFVSVMAATKMIAKATITALGADAYNIIINNGKASGQVIPHLHVHIVPRFPDDGLHLEWPHKKYAEGEIDEIAGKIRGELE